MALGLGLGWILIRGLRGGWTEGSVSMMEYGIVSQGVRRSRRIGARLGLWLGLGLESYDFCDENTVDGTYDDD
eukprot:1337954-Amorphochlora_amoeboformis.AAC.1